MNWELLKELSDAPGLPGAEEKIRDIIYRELSPMTDEITVDAMGNIIVHIPGEGPKFMLDAHMDEVGFMVSHIDDRGFIRVIPLGGIDPRVFYAQRVVIWGREKVYGVVGAVPPHLTRSNPSSRNETVPIEDCFIDTGLSAEKVHELVRVGDLVTFDRECVETEESLIGKAFDDRVGVFMLIEGVKAARKLDCDLYLVGAVQEEGGLRGAGPAAHQVQPDVALSLEGTVANDIPGAPAHKQFAHQGRGPEIRLSDGRFIASRDWVFFISNLAKEFEIPHQIVVKKVGGTNAAEIQTTGSGTKATALAIPVRYIHSPQGIVRKSDVQAGVELVAKLIENVSRFFAKD